MSETEPKKRGFFSKLFGLDQPEPPRAPEPAPAPLPEPPAEPVAEIVPEAEPEALVASEVPLSEAEPRPPIAPPEPQSQLEPAQPKRSWWRRLRDGLSRTSSALTTGISDLFTKRKLDAATLEDLEDILIQADLGLATSARIAKAVGEGRYDKQIEPEEVKAILAREVEAI
ncbi:MAG: signal recognition particle-docking protein FtsY, partial [Hyphomicrobiales bacterium]